MNKILNYILIKELTGFKISLINNSSPFILFYKTEGEKMGKQKINNLKYFKIKIWGFLTASLQITLAEKKLSENQKI